MRHQENNEPIGKINQARLRADDCLNRVYLPRQHRPVYKAVFARMLKQMQTTRAGRQVLNAGMAPIYLAPYFGEQRQDLNAYINDCGQIVMNLATIAIPVRVVAQAARTPAELNRLVRHIPVDGLTGTLIHESVHAIQQDDLMGYDALRETAPTEMLLALQLEEIEPRIMQCLHVMELRKRRSVDESDSIQVLTDYMQAVERQYKEKVRGAYTPDGAYRAIVQSAVMLLLTGGMLTQRWQWQGPQSILHDLDHTRDATEQAAAEKAFLWQHTYRQQFVYLTKVYANDIAAGALGMADRAYTAYILQRLGLTRDDLAPDKWLTTFLQNTCQADDEHACAASQRSEPVLVAEHACWCEAVNRHVRPRCHVRA